MNAGQALVNMALGASIVFVDTAASAKAGTRAKTVTSVSDTCSLIKKSQTNQ